MLETLELTNWCQHRRLKVEFRPGLNGILGANGRGKSNFLEALKVAFTNTTTAVGSMRNNITYGQKEAEIDLGFTTDGVHYSLVRKFSDEQARARLVYPGGVISKAGEIEQFIQDLYNTSINLMVDNVFIAQGRIDEILMTSDTRRLKEFQASFGLDKIDQAYKILTAENNAYQVTPGLSDALAAHVELTRQARADHEALVAEHQAAQKQIAELEPCRTVIQRALEAIQHRAAYTLAREHAEHTELDVQKATATLEKEQAALCDIESQWVMRNPSVQAARQQIRLLEQMHDGHARYSQLVTKRSELVAKQAALGPVCTQSEADALAATVADVTEQLRHFEHLKKFRDARPKLEGQAELEAQCEQLRQRLAAPTGVPPEIAELGAQAQALTRQLDQLGTGVCPTCGQEVHGGPELLKIKVQQLSVANTMYDHAVFDHHARVAHDRLELQKTLDDRSAALTAMYAAGDSVVDASLTRLTAELAAARQKHGQAVTALTKASQVSQELEYLTATMAGLPAEPVDDQLLASLRTQVFEFQEVETKRAVLRERQALAKTQADRAQTVHAEAQARLKQMAGVYDGPSEAEVEKAKAQAEQLGQRVKYLSDLGVRLGMAEGLATQRETEARRLLSQSQKEADDLAWLAVVRQAREALHVSQYPARAMREYSTILNRHVEHYLLMLEAQFKMWLDDEMKFMVLFTSGEKRGIQCPATRLSGAEKVLASMSFRLAMADTFARNIGLLVLDEPTAYLDKDNIQHMQNLLLKLREISQVKGRQILIVTHEDSLKGFLDHIIQI
jgi:exonuclease SbcC